MEGWGAEFEEKTLRCPRKCKVSTLYAKKYCYSVNVCVLWQYTEKTNLRGKFQTTPNLEIKVSRKWRIVRSLQSHFFPKSSIARSLHTALFLKFSLCSELYSKDNILENQMVSAQIKRFFRIWRSQWVQQSDIYNSGSHSGGKSFVYCGSSLRIHSCIKWKGAECISCCSCLYSLMSILRIISGRPLFIFRTLSSSIIFQRCSYHASNEPTGLLDEPSKIVNSTKIVAEFLTQSRIVPKAFQAKFREVLSSQKKFRRTFILACSVTKAFC